MTDYKQLCAELLRAMDEIEECEAVDWSLVKTQPPKMANQSMAEVRAALAEPDPESEGPTDEELANTYWTTWHEYLDRTNSVLHAVGLRAVLARWGNHQGSPQPIPVSERLPGPEDCDAWERSHPISNIWCWWWDSNESVWVRDEADTPRPSYLTHWLPAHVLSQPS